MNPCPVGQVTRGAARRAGRPVPPLPAAGAAGGPGDGAVAAPLGAVPRRSWRRCAQERPQVLDGFTRWEAAQQVRGMTTLLVRLIEVDDRGPRRRFTGSTRRVGGRTSWKKRGSFRRWCARTGCPRAEVAELLGRHKSWVCRRLALLEKLAADVRQDLEVGLLTPDRGAGDRPVARGQPIGSPRCVAARGAQRRRARRRGPPAPGSR